MRQEAGKFYYNGAENITIVGESVLLPLRLATSWVDGVCSDLPCLGAKTLAGLSAQLEEENGAASQSQT